MKPFTMGLIAARYMQQSPVELPERTDLPVVPEKLSVESLLPQGEPYRSIARSIMAGNVEGTRKLAAAAVRNGADPLEVALNGLLKGMDAVSVLYNHRQAYVPDVILAAKALNAGLEVSGGKNASLGRKGTVIIHTADGDLHDIGKNIIAAIVEANGYRVIDLGTSVETSRVIAAIKEHRPAALLGSSLMTSTRNAFLVTADELKKEGIDVPFIVGGGACDHTFAGQRANLRYAKDPDSLVIILNTLHTGNKHG